STDALSPRRGGQRGLETIGAPAERHVGRVDREGEDVEDHFACAGRADVGPLRAPGELLGLPVAIDQDLLHGSFSPAGLISRKSARCARLPRPSWRGTLR